MARRLWSELEKKRLAALLFENLTLTKRGWVITSAKWKKIQKRFPKRTIGAVKGRAYRTGLLAEIRKAKVAAPPPKKPIYRYLLAIAYSSQKEKIEYRVWIHSRTPEKYDERDLWKKFDELMAIFPSNVIGHLRTIGLELFPYNEIDENEIEPSSAELNEWFGFANFDRGYKKYARDRLSGWLSECPDFKTREWYG